MGDKLVDGGTLPESDSEGDIDAEIVATGERLGVTPCVDDDACVVVGPCATVADFEDEMVAVGEGERVVGAVEGEAIGVNAAERVRDVVAIGVKVAEMEGEGVAIGEDVAERVGICGE